MEHFRRELVPNPVHSRADCEPTWLPLENNNSSPGMEMTTFFLWETFQLEMNYFSWETWCVWQCPQSILINYMEIKWDKDNMRQRLTGRGGPWRSKNWSTLMVTEVVGSVLGWIHHHRQPGTGPQPVFGSLRGCLWWPITWTTWDWSSGWRTWRRRGPRHFLFQIFDIQSDHGLQCRHKRNRFNKVISKAIYKVRQEISSESDQHKELLELPLQSRIYSQE